MRFNFRFTIARKLTVGFSVILIAVISTSFFNYRTLDKNLEINLGVISNVYNPSRSHLSDLYTAISNSKVLIKNWVFVDRKENTPEKQRLRKLLSEDIPQLEEELAPYVSKWPENLQQRYNNVVMAIDTLINEHQNIMSQLNNFEAYNDIMKLFSIKPKVEEGGDVILLTERILDDLSFLISEQEKLIEQTNNNMVSSFANLQMLIIFMAVFLVVSVIIIGLITTRALVNPINNLKEIILQMGKGVLPQKPVKERNDEIGEMAHEINVLVKGLRETSEFANQIGEGNFESKFTPLSEYDVLGNSLLLMRENLKKASEEDEKRKEEDRQRSWAAQGLAKFGEILRESTEDMEEFSYRIISNLVKYLDAHIGGFYLVNDDNPEDVHLELKATYAYGRQKYIEKRIDYGVTVVGQVAEEKEKIYMTEIPEDYIKISSGLGDDNPKSLLVMPLIMNEELYGIMEIASFEELPRYKIDFVDQVSEIIAATISNVKVNLHTAKLLEESQEKSERMAKQEEETKRQIEEMKKKQEELQQKNKEEQEKSEKLKEDFNKKLRDIEAKLKENQEQLTQESIYLQGTQEAINNTLGYVEMTMQGIFTKANNQYLKMTNMRIEQLNGKRQSNFMLKEKVNKPEYQKLWSDLNKGVSRFLTIQYYFHNKEKWFRESYTPIQDSKNNYHKVIVLSMDVTEEVLESTEKTEETTL